MRQDETMIAAAVEGANGVSASSIPTGISFTLVYVQTHSFIIICFKTSVTNAIKTSQGVNTLSMTTYIGSFLTFIAIVAMPCGGEAIARLAVTAEAARCVDALSVALAHLAVLALVDIFTN